MKLAIIGTTINGESGYLPFDRLAAESEFSDVSFVVAGDTNSKPFDTSGFKCRIEYLEPKDQERFAVSETIGWKTPRRRPAAWLRAIELEPDYILSIDDDNIPPDDYFATWHRVLTTPVGRVAAAKTGVSEPQWYNYLASSDAPIEIYPRGFPLAFRTRTAVEITAAPEAIKPAAIGLWQGISLGDPDIDAMTRLVWPARTPLASIGEKNYCLRDIWSPYNMQNTAYAPSLFGLPILWPHAGRFDDIYASFVFQKFLFNTSRYAYVGDPINRQDRGVRDTLRLDFPEEVEGYAVGHEVWRVISEISETDPVRFLERIASAIHPAIERERAFFRAYLKDLAAVLP